MAGQPLTPTGEHRLVETAQSAVATGLVINAVLSATKLVAGVLGNSYALIADAAESGFDILGSLVVLGGMRIASRREDDEYPFGYGKAESLAGAVVAFMLMGASVGIAIEAVREIVTPHHAPAPYTLVVLVAVVAIKWATGRRVARASAAAGASAAADADAMHHYADAVTSVAAFVGISVALVGGPGWEPADDWAALLASGVIFVNGVRVLRPALGDLMDRAPGAAVRAPVQAAALAVPGVRSLHALRIRRSGTGFHVDVHVQADPQMSLDAAHRLSGAVKAAIRASGPGIRGVLVHMEPDEASATPASS
ncbi:MAG: cation diffusion facilitator family transporter [Gemmatimonadota bacterium]|nr:cation diffusion facilitator family transporter [Gemmatimonadota bacterium]